MEIQEIKRGFNSYTLKIIAIICMVVDHVGAVFVPDGSALGTLMHFIGRFTIPIMAFFIAEGYKKSRNVADYILRLLILAVASVIPFTLLFGPIYGSLQNTIFSLLLGLCALYYAGKTENRFFKAIIVFLCMLISIVILADGAVSVVLLIYLMGTIKGRKKAVWLSITIMNAADLFLTFAFPLAYGQMPAFGITDVIVMLGTFIPAFFLSQYNGERGKSAKYLFYFFYPLHLLIIWAIRFALLNLNLI